MFEGALEFFLSPEVKGDTEAHCCVAECIPDALLHARAVAYTDTSDPAYGQFDPEILGVIQGRQTTLVQGQRLPGPSGVNIQEPVGDSRMADKVQLHTPFGQLADDLGVKRLAQLSPDIGLRAA